MDIAALGISILALGASLWAIKYTRRQALAAEQERHAQRTPKFEPSMSLASQGNVHWFELTLRLLTEPLAKVQVSTDKTVMTFVRVHAQGSDSSVATHEDLTTGDTVTWRVAFFDVQKRPDKTWVTVTSTAKSDKKTWTTPVQVTVPRRPGEAPWAEQVVSL